MFENGQSGDILIYEEVHEEAPSVSRKDIEEYSRRLGIDIQGDDTACAIVRDWILQPLPNCWFPCYDSGTANWFYFNGLNGQSSWQHPLEQVHRSLARTYFLDNSAVDCLESREPLAIDQLIRENPEGESADTSMEGGIHWNQSRRLAGLLGPVTAPLNNHPPPRTLAPLKGTGGKDLHPPLPHNADRNAQLPHLPDFSSRLKENGTNVGLHPPRRMTSFRPQDDAEPSLNPLRPNPLKPLEDSEPSSGRYPPRRMTSFRPQDDTEAGTALYPRRMSTFRPQEDAEPGLNTLRLNALRPLEDCAPSDGLYPARRMSSFREEDAADAGSNPLRSGASRPVSAMSFTERLAAKRATKVKTEDAPAASSASSDDRRRVQFDMSWQNVCNYTPEHSDKNTADGSESTCSEDLVNDLVAGRFRSASDLLPAAAFDEKRWDVSFTSFGVASAKDKSNERLQEMVTDFVDSDPESSPVDHHVPDPHPLSAPESPVKDHSGAVIANKRTEEMVTDFIDSDPESSPVDNHALDPHPFSAPKSPVKDHCGAAAEQCDHVAGSPAHNSLSFLAADKLGHDDEGSPCSSTDNNSRIIADASSVKNDDLHAGPTNGSLSLHESSHVPSAANNPTTVVNVPSGIQGSLRDSANAAESIRIGPDSQSDRDPVQQRRSPRRDIQSDVDDQPTISSEAADPPADPEPQPALNIAELKQEMESQMDSEKAKMETWFRQELTKIKLEFEQELATERRLCSDLLAKEKQVLTQTVAALIESAKTETRTPELNRIDAPAKIHAAEFVPDGNNRRQDAHIELNNIHHGHQDAVVQTDQVPHDSGRRIANFIDVDRCPAAGAAGGQKEAESNADRRRRPPEASPKDAVVQTDQVPHDSGGRRIAASFIDVDQCPAGAAGVEKEAESSADRRRRRPPEAATPKDAVVQTEPVPHNSADAAGRSKKIPAADCAADQRRMQPETESMSCGDSCQSDAAAEAVFKESCACRCIRVRKQMLRAGFLPDKKRSSSRTMKKASVAQRNVPLKAKHDCRHVVDSDESTSLASLASLASSPSSSSISQVLPPARSRSRSLNNLRAPSEKHVWTAVERARCLLSRCQSRGHIKAQHEEIDLSSDTPTSGFSSCVSNYEWDSVLRSIHKISGDLRQVWTHIGQCSLNNPPYFHSAISQGVCSTPYANHHRWPAFTPHDSTAEKTRALRKWLQQNNSQFL